MIKKFFVLVAVIFAVNFSTVFAMDSVTDTAHLLSTNEIQMLTQKIQQVEQKHKIKIGVNFAHSIGGHDVEIVAKNFLKKNFSDGQNGGIVLLVAMDVRKWRIVTDEKMESRLNAVNVSGVGGFVDKLTEGNYYSAAESYINAVDKMLTYYEQNGSPYDPVNEFNPLALMAAIVISIVIGFMIRSGLIGSMSNVRHAFSAGNYLKNDSVNIINSQDIYLFTNVSRRPKPTSNNSSGRRSGGGGGSAGGSF